MVKKRSLGAAADLAIFFEYCKLYRISTGAFWRRSRSRQEQEEEEEEEKEEEEQE